jgi:hypothetical protein
MATTLTLNTEFIKVRFPSCEIVRIMRFSSRELRITLTNSAVVWTFKIDHSALQDALECRYEDSLARGRLCEFSGEKCLTLVS